MSFLLILSLILVLPVHASDTALKPGKSKIQTTTDLRVLVDISGSMKKTDPKNLRRSAVRLLAGLIPQNSQAGIWNFGKQVNMAVKIGTVNDAWRDQAREQSKKISSVGLYTNIESAMRSVSFDWKKPDPRYKRNLILLTDGHVDVSQDDKQDQASRKRIIKDILPMLEKAKVRIHTIALSDDVDESLLSTLSAYTDGLYKKVNSADELQKLFLQMLEQSVNLDTIPIEDNRFNVDANINDMTLLVFNKDKAHPTKIVTPGKRTWDIKKSADNVKWFRDDGFDLITIKKPQHGQWKIFAPIDPNNRVVVATNLKLELSDSPGYIMSGDTLNVTVHLEEDGKPLADQRLLSKFKFDLKRKSNKNSERHYPLTKSETNEANYTVQLAPIYESGNNELIIQAKSPTAQREVRHQFQVYATPAEIKIIENHGKYQVEIKPYSNLLKTDSINLNIVLKDKSQHELKKQGDVWIVDVDDKYQESLFTLNLKALRADGKPISMSLNKVLSTQHGTQKLTLPKKIVKQKIEPNHNVTKKPPAKSQKNTTSAHDNTKEKKDVEIDWTLIIISIVAANLLLIGLLGGGYAYLKRRKEKMSAQLGQEMAADDDKVEELPEQSVDKTADE